MTQGLSKQEKLKSRTLIKNIFECRNTLYNKPIRLFYTEMIPSNDLAMQVGFVVSKRNFKNAVDRNRIKRLMRESYRKRKNMISFNKKYVMMFLFQGHSMPTYDLIDEKIKNTLNQCAKL